MNNFYFKIHSESLSNTKNQGVEENITAEPIKNWLGWTISVGAKTERLSIIAKETTYALAIETLTVEQQANIKQRGSDGWWKAFLWQPWKSFFWQPLTLQTTQGDVTILVNINSAVKRSGLSRKEVKEQIKKGSLVITIQKKYLTEFLKNNPNKATAYSNISGSRIFKDFDAAELDQMFLEITTKGISLWETQKAHLVKKFSALSAEKIEKICHYIYQFNLSFEKAIRVGEYTDCLECSPEEAIQALDQLNKHGISKEEIKRLLNFIKTYKKSWKEKFEAGRNEPIYIKAGKVSKTRNCVNDIPANLQYNKNGAIYLIFNQVRTKGHSLLGKGTYKTAKTALCLTNGMMRARITMNISDLSLEGIAAAELEFAAGVKNQKACVKTYGETVRKYKPKNGGKDAWRMSYMQDLFNGGDANQSFHGLSKKEKYLIAKRLCEAVCCFHQKEFLHRDIKLENLFLIKDPASGEVVDCALGDWGTCTKRSDEIERTTLKGTLDYCPPEIIFNIEKTNNNGNFDFRKDVTPQLKKEINDVSHDLWSLGVVLYMCLKSDISEWNSFSERFFLSNDIEGNLRRFQAHSFPKPKSKASIGHTILGLLDFDHKKRMPASQVLANLTKFIQEKGVIIS